MLNTSRIELSRSALENNIRFVRKIAGKNTKVSTVVKGNAYGHGIDQIVPMAETCGVDHFSVFSADEAYRCEKVAHPETEILIMGMIDEYAVPWAVANGIDFYVFTLERLRNAVKAAKRTKMKAKVHIEIETGMNRTGFNCEELEDVFRILKDNSDKIELKALTTHFAGAESIANYHRIKSQLRLFRRACRVFEENELKPEIYHSACSAAAIRYPKTRMDMIRVGILNYGFWPNMETFINYISGRRKYKNPLKRVITWKSRVMSIKNVKTGEFIGYGTSYLASKDMKIATVPVGYGHGFARSLSNHGRVLVNNERVSVIGIVNMNLITIDVTDVPQTKIGDEVVLIGDQGDKSVTVASFSDRSNQLKYELLTRLPENIPRFSVD